MRDFIRNLLNTENLINVGKLVANTFVDNTNIRLLIADQVFKKVNEIITSNNIDIERIEKYTKLGQDIVECVMVAIRIIAEYKKTGVVNKFYLNALESWSKGLPTPNEYKGL